MKTLNKKIVLLCALRIFRDQKPNLSTFGGMRDKEGGAVYMSFPVHNPRPDINEDNFLIRKYHNINISINQ